ncbi:MAG: ABC transporter permease [Evtepia gabavorous]
MRACDTFQSFPSILLVLAMVTLLGPSVWNIILVIGGLGWASVARLVYSGTLSAKKAEYVEASRALGATDREILFRTILPNVVAPVWASCPLKVVRAILSESSLSFWGWDSADPPGLLGQPDPERHGAGGPHHPPLGLAPAGCCALWPPGWRCSWWGRGCGRPSTPATDEETDCLLGAKGVK